MFIPHLFTARPRAVRTLALCCAALLLAGGFAVSASTVPPTQWWRWLVAQAAQPLHFGQPLTRATATTEAKALAGPAVSANVVISQVYGAGGNTGATYRNDYIELFNRGTSSVTLNGWSVQYTSSTGTGSFSSNVTPLTNVTLAPGQYYLVHEAGGANGASLPAADATGTISMSATAGKVILANTTTGLACNGSSTPCNATQLAQIVDLVGYGTGTNYFEGTGPTGSISTTLAALRASGGCTDTDNNSTDFATATPNPRNTSLTATPCGVVNAAVVPVCPGSLTTNLGTATSGNVSASDADGTVTLATISNITPSNPGTITLDSFTPAGAVGGTASAVLNVSNATPANVYTVTLTWSNNDATPQTATCNITVTVTNPGITLIHDIQGNTETPNFIGQVVTIRGIVTGDFQGGSGAGLSGFFIQEEDADADADANTSEGLFVFDGTTPAVNVNVGDQVTVIGTVLNFGGANGLTELSPVSSVTVNSSGNQVPAAVSVSLPVGNAPAADLEKYEGMRVQFAQSLYVTDNEDLGAFGELSLAANGPLYIPTNSIDPNDNPASGTTITGNSNVAAVTAQQTLNNNSRIILDDSKGGSNPNPIPFIGAGTNATVRRGDSVTNLAGILSFGFSAYRIEPTGPVSFTANNPRPSAPDAVGSSTLKVASFNVENYFVDPPDPTGRGPNTVAELTRKRAKVVAAIAGLNADVVGLIELEKGTQATADAAAADIVSALNALGNLGTWAVVATPAAVYTGPVGTDTEIKSGIIYRTDKVALVGSSFTDTAAATGAYSRAPIAQTFQQLSNNEKFTLVVNHFRSKGCPGTGADNDLGDGQSCYNDRRRSQAQAIVAFVNTVIVPVDPDVLVVGDLNAYGQEDPIDVFRAAGFSDVLNTYVAAANQYSYTFTGETGRLDHVFATSHLASQLTGGTLWHINADEPVVFDYNTENKPDDRYAATPYASADHDPALVGLALATSADVAITKQGTPNPVTAGANLTYSISVSNGGPDAAANVQWTDALPVGTTFVSLSAPGGWSCTTPAIGTTGTVTCSLASLANSASANFSLVVQVGANVAGGTMLTNTASVTSTSVDSNTNNDSSTIMTTVNAPPSVLSLTRVNASPTNAASVQYSVTFSESVSGVSTGNFALVPTGAVTGANVTGVAGSGTLWTVTVNTGTGSGSLGLNLVNSTGIADGDGAPLSNVPFSGQVYVIDKDEPETTLTGNPTNPTKLTSATFNFTGNDGTGAGVAGFECRLDSGVFTACSSGQNYTNLAGGSHTFEVRALDNAGNVESTPATFTWLVDVIAPETNITSNPALVTNSTSASFAFNGSDGGSGVASFECQLDSQGFTACTSPQSYSNLSAGPHSFQVRAIDGAGNVDGSPALFNWTIDTIAPTVTINQASGQNDPTSGSPINFTVVFSEAVTGFSSGDVSVSGTAGATLGAVTEVAPNNGTTYNVAVSGMVASGTVIAAISANVAADAAGNGNAVSSSTDNTVTYNLPTGPTQTAVSGNPSPSFTGQSVTFTATVTANGNPVTTGTVTFSVDGTPQASNLPLNASGQATFTISTLTEGVHAILANYSGADGFAPSNLTIYQTVDTPTVVNGNTYCNPGGIAIPAGSLAPVVAAPYPSRIFVTGFKGTLAKVTLTLNNFTHEAPNDLSFMLVGPNAKKFVFMSGVGGASAVTGANVTFDDTAASALTTLATGTFKPTAASTSVTFPAPAPSAPAFAAPAGADTFATNFNGISPNGTWMLFVVDKTSGATVGSIGEWCLTFTSLCPTITVGPANNLNATVGAPFSQVFTQTGGAVPISFSLNGALPMGLAFNGNTLGGTPAEAGTFNFTVTAQDTNGCTGSQAYTLIVGCPPIALSPATLPGGGLGTAYQQQLTAGPVATLYGFAVTGGSLPPGLNLAPNGLLSGNPTAAGQFTFTVTATGFGSCTGSQTYTVVISSVCQTLTVDPATLPGGSVGTAYTQALTANGGAGPYTFAVTAGALPNGLSLSSSGAIAGTPTASGFFSFTVTVTGAGGCTGNRFYTLNISCTSFTWSSALPNAFAGVAYNQTISATGATSYSVFSGNLPPGMTLNAATGVITGTATSLGLYNFTVLATAAGGCSGTQAYSIAVLCPSIVISPANTTLPNGSVGTAYSQVFSATPAGNYNYSIASGALPPGLTLNSSTGVLSGTPATLGAYSFTVKVTGFGSCQGSQSYSLTITASCATITLPTLPATGKVGVNYFGSLTGTTPSANYTFTVQSGSLPPGVSINNLFAALMGKPTAAGTYNFTIKATRSNGCTSTRAYTIVISNLANALARLSDFDGDGQSDLGVWRGTKGEWLVLRSADGQTSSAIWGTELAPYRDVIASGDYDGDGLTDLAVYRRSDGNFYVQGSRNGIVQVQELAAGDNLPVAGDYDGDGQTDFAIWQPATGNWLIKRSSDGELKTVTWGAGYAPYNDVPVPGDYDGDGKTDCAIFRPATGTWFVLRSNDGGISVQTWGAASDVPVAGDYDGDGKADLAVWRGTTGEWFVLRSSDNGYTISRWGALSAGDVPVPGDYDGDGKLDFAVWRAPEGRWYVLHSRDNSVRMQQHGQVGDQPVTVRVNQ